MDLVWFAVVGVGFFVIGLPLITRRVSVPTRVRFEDVADHELTEGQARCFAELDPQLLGFGYRPVGDRRTVNMQGRALIRTYMSDADPAIVMMNLLTSGVEGTAEHPMNYLEIVTRYGDGTILSTRNAEISEVLATMPGHIIQERKGVRHCAKLKLAHDAKAGELLPRGPLYCRPDDFERVFDEFHERWCLHQIESGLLVSRADDPQRLRPTVKAGLRGIANFLNPLADNFTVARFLVVVLLGLVAPMSAVLWLEGPGSWLITRAAAASGLSPEVCATACIAAVLAGIGALVGLLFVGKAFIWGFLLTYVVLRLAGPSGPWSVVALSVWTAVISHWAAGWRERRDNLA